ncbi:hypothetical protein [Pseudomonas phage PfAC20]
MRIAPMTRARPTSTATAAITNLATDPPSVLACARTPLVVSSSSDSAKETLATARPTVAMEALRNRVFIFSMIGTSLIARFAHGGNDQASPQTNGEQPDGPGEAEAEGRRVETTHQQSQIALCLRRQQVGLYPLKVRTANRAVRVLDPGLAHLNRYRAFHSCSPQTAREAARPSIQPQA